MWQREPEHEYFARASSAAADMIDPKDPALMDIIRAIMQLAGLEFDIADPEVVQRAIDVGRRNHAHGIGRPIQSRPAVAPVTDGEVVYYMRIGNRVKIGYSSNLVSRLAAINPEELMAAEPGNMQTEKDRHVQFSRLRTHGEWFRLEGSLEIHIARLKAGGAGVGSRPRGPMADGSAGLGGLDQAV
jgi:hypothetical protein